MSDLFDQFDDLAEKFGVHKIKTIGDAYVACAGAFGDAGQHNAFGDHGGLPAHALYPVPYTQYPVPCTSLRRSACTRPPVPNPHSHP